MSHFDNLVHRFAVCAQNANDDDIVYAWNVISEMATEVIQACDRWANQVFSSINRSFESESLLE